MKAFHNDQKVKDKYLACVKKHRELDNLIQGTTWKGGKGCAVGCTLENYDHKSYETELGISEWLAHVEDIIFEGLDKKEAMDWPEQFLDSINPGSDLDKLKSPFVVFVLKSTLENFDREKFPDVKHVVDLSIEVAKSNWNDKAAAMSAAEASRSVWSAVEAPRSVWSSAWSAESARSSAWSAVEAVEAAESARSAAWSARSAAMSAAWSARSAAMPAAYSNFAKELLRLMRECK